MDIGNAILLIVVAGMTGFVVGASFVLQINGKVYRRHGVCCCGTEGLTGTEGET